MSGPQMKVALTTGAEQQEAPRLNSFQRLIGTIFSPEETFQDINRKPDFILPVIVAIVIAVAGNLVINGRLKPDWEKIIRQQYEQQLARQGKTLADLPEQQRQSMESQIKLWARMAPFFPVTAIVSTPVMIAFLALLFWVGTILIQGQSTYKKVFSVTAYAFGVVIISVQTLLSIVVTFLRNPEDIDILKGIVITNPGMLMPPTSSPVLVALLTRLDLIAIWFLVLMSIGLAAVCKKVSAGKAAIIVFGLWGIWVVLRVAWTAIAGQ